MQHGSTPHAQSLHRGVRAQAGRPSAQDQKPGRGGQRTMRGRGGGRGAYYKEKYGRPREPRRDGGERRGLEADGTTYAAESAAADDSVCGTSQQLHTTLQRIHNRPYPAYKDLRGRWQFASFTLVLDRVQADPYAAPSACRVLVPAAVAALPPALWRTSRPRRIALCDYLTRAFGAAVTASGGHVRAGSGGWHGAKGGEMSVDRPGQHVIERSSVLIHPDGSVEARFTVGLPAQGRTILGDWAAAVLLEQLPRCVQTGLCFPQLDAAAVTRHVFCVEDTDALRAALPSRGLVAFVGNGSVLARASGASDAPMPAAVPFASPPSMAVTLELPNRGRVRGMGIRQGLTLICGGGFHGKSTLLEALQCGVYNKIPGDGRELVAVDPGAVKVRAEDGRCVAQVDITPFMSDLPGGRTTAAFGSTDASGSTSQAAGIQEAVEVGATVLLIDEDTSATNFMMRDARMQELVVPDKEPITPFSTRVRGLAAGGVSCILVVGGTGEYFALADCVVAMDAYCPQEVTQKAHDIAARHAALPGLAAAVPQSTAQLACVHPPVPPRSLVSIAPASGGQGGEQHSGGGGFRAKTRALSTIQIDEEELDLGGVEQLVEVSQTRAVAEAIAVLRRRAAGPWQGLALGEALARLDAELDEQGLDVLGGDMRPGNLSRPRKFEFAAAVNRLRSAVLRQLPRP